MGMPFAAALSEHPVTAYAVGEATGQVLEQLGPHPDLAVVFVTPPHAGALEDIAATVRAVLEPTLLIGCASESIVGTGQEVERTAAVSVWAGRFGPLAPVRITATRTTDGWLFDGLPDAQVPFAPSALVLLADPYSFPTEDFLATMAERHPGLPVVGGMASGAQGYGGSRLALDGSVVVDGALGALLGPGAGIDTIVSQGCRPIGSPFVVTEGEGQFIRQLAGKPALARLDEIASALSSDDIGLINRSGLHLGRVIDEHKATFARGDFLVRTVMGGDRETGAIAVNDQLEVGTTVQFHVRDADSADEDLRDLVGQRAAEERADGVLLFTCNGRGQQLFGEPHHDAGVLADLLGPVPTAGMFAAGEIGPVGGRNFFHGFTASVVLFSDAPA
jgi:small ligand-binding sensory domain FIST